MLITAVVVILILLWISGFFGPPTIPEITLPTIAIAWSDPFIQALLIVAVIVVIVMLIR